MRVTAPAVRITTLTALTQNRPIPLAGGGTSPRGSVAAGGTTLLGFASIALDALDISQSGAGPFAVGITNAGSGPQAATIGGAGQQVQLWGVLRGLQLCVTVALLQDAVEAYTGRRAVQDQLDELLTRAKKDVDPKAACTDIKALAPLLGALIANGGTLPDVIRGKNLDIDVYALRVTAPGKATSLNLPVGRLTVTPR